MSGVTTATAYDASDVMDPTFQFGTVAAGSVTNGTVLRNDGNDWVADGFVAGDLVIVAGSTSNDGTYLVVGVTADTLTLANAEFTDEPSVAGVTFTRHAEDTALVPTLEFVDNGNGTSSIIRTDGIDWSADGFDAGELVLVAGSTPENNDIYEIESVSGDTLTVWAGDFHLPLDAGFDEEASLPGVTVTLYEETNSMSGSPDLTFVEAGFVQRDRWIGRSDGLDWGDDGFVAGL